MEADKFKLAVADCKKLCDVLPIPLGDGCGEGEPEFSEDCVWFNGSVNSGSFAHCAGITWPDDRAEGVGLAGENVVSGEGCAGPLLIKRAVDLKGNGSCETFGILRNIRDDYPNAKAEENGLFGCWCKTGFLPYDLNVQCCLIIFKHHFGSDFLVESDGTSDQWWEARECCQYFLHYGLDFELHVQRTEAEESVEV